jgi:outer membrane protein assembly factor BamB
MCGIKQIICNESHKGKFLQELLLHLILMISIGLPGISEACEFGNSLWLGNNNNVGITFPVLTTDRAGNEFRRIYNTQVTGIAIDPTANRIYFGKHDGEITVRDLNNPAVPIATLNPPFSSSLSDGSDMAFDGTHLWRTDIGNRNVQKIDPNTGVVVFSFTPAVHVLGIAWDGAHLWMSQYTGFVGKERIIQFTPQGDPTGLEFPAPLGGGHVGGLAFDTTDNTRWIGGIDQVHHVDTTGNLLGSFKLPATNRFIDGLEFQGVGKR